MFREKAKDGSTRLTGLTLSDIMLALHPVNEIYFSVDNVNPSTKFGGTWVAWGSGRVPVGVDTAQTEFATVELTGGHKAMQQHNHGGATGYVSNDHTHQVAGRHIANTATGGTGERVNDVGNAGLSTSAVFTGNTGGISANHYHGINNDGTGNAQNLQPFITVYMWKRTA